MVASAGVLAAGGESIGCYQLAQLSARDDWRSLTGLTKGLLPRVIIALEVQCREIQLA